MKPWFNRVHLAGVGFAAGAPPVQYYMRPEDVHLGQRGQVAEIRVGTLEDRIVVIKKQVQLGIRDPRMHRVAYAVTQHCPWRDDSCEAKAIFDWVTQSVCAYNPVQKRMVCQTRVRYVGEPADLDTYRSPMETLDLRAGDCDDLAALIGAMALINGFYAKAIVTSNTGDSWDHIYPLLALPKGQEPGRSTNWAALDVTLGPGAFGQSPPQAKKTEFPL